MRACTGFSKKNIVRVSGYFPEISGNIFHPTKQARSAYVGVLRFALMSSIIREIKSLKSLTYLCRGNRNLVKDE